MTKNILILNYTDYGVTMFARLCFYRVNFIITNFSIYVFSITIMLQVVIPSYLYLAAASNKLYSRLLEIFLGKTYCTHIVSKK